MKTLLSLLLLISAPLLWSEPIDPENPKMFREQKKLVDKKLSSLRPVPIQSAPGLFRAWVNPVSRVKSPSSQTLTVDVIQSSVRKPEFEQAFFKTKEWKPGKIVFLYDKSKDFSTVLNPLSLKDINRFIYQRNPSSP
ncbi:MAG: hypothetical protein O7C75_03680 [Verrucomicrobia bacterium]|nr:hypothetical protein [Verrucomicrobiota bacterium]